MPRKMHGMTLNRCVLISALAALIVCAACLAPALLA